MVTHRIIVKPTMMCNINCSYCYIKQDSKKIMTECTLKKMIEESARLDTNIIEFIWHGGEPLLLSEGFYKTAMQEQRYITDFTGIRFINKIQTNGTLIDDSCAEFFSKNNFEVGLSLDGPKVLHDMNRVNSLGQSTYEKTIQGYYNLKKYKVPVGILCVVSPVTLNKTQAFTDWLLELECESISFNWRFDLREMLLDPKWAYLYARFLLELEERCRTSGFYINIRELILERNNTKSNKQHNIKFCSNLQPCFYTFSTVDPHGNIYLGCDKFINNKSKEFVLGNVFRGGFKKAFNSPIFKKYEKYFFEGKKYCKNNCSEFLKCQGVCLADWFSNGSEISNEFIPRINKCTATSLSRYINMGGN